MKYKIVYNQLLQKVENKGWTIKQVQDATKKQVANILNLNENSAFWSGGNKGFFINLKLNICQELQRQQNENDKQYLSNRVNMATVRQRFPDIEFEFREIDSKRCVCVWLDGKPEIEDIE